MAKKKYTMQNASEVPYREQGSIGPKTLAKMLREADPSTYRQAKADGEWDEYVETMLRMITRTANNLMDAGEINTQAWRRATVLHVHGKEWD